MICITSGNKGWSNRCTDTRISKFFTQLQTSFTFLNVHVHKLPLFFVCVTDLRTLLLPKFVHLLPSYIMFHSAIHDTRTVTPCCHIKSTTVKLGSFVKIFLIICIPISKLRSVFWSNLSLAKLFPKHCT